MRSLAKSSLLISLLWLLAGCSDSGGDVSKGEGWVEHGPDLSQLQLTDLQGNHVVLSDYAGKSLVINFWATWCAPCRHEMPALQSLSDQLDPERYAVLGITVDEDQNLAEEFLREQGISFKQFIDPQMVLALSELKVRAFPETFIVSSDGQLLRRIVGAREWDKQSYYQSILP
ncbi:MAG: TlpA disulfide reductase family protein [Motiliproteus sp.]